MLRNARMTGMRKLRRSVQIAVGRRLLADYGSLHDGGERTFAAVGAKVRYRTEQSELNKYFSTVPSASGISLCAAETGVKLGAKDVSELLFPTSKAPIAPQLNSQTHWSVS